MATNKSWKDDKGNKHEASEWHVIVCWDGIARSCGEWLAKGSRVLVVGELHTRQWQDKNDVRHYRTEVVAHRVQFLDDKNTGKAKREAEAQGARQGEGKRDEAPREKPSAPASGDGGSERRHGDGRPRFSSTTGKPIADTRDDDDIAF